jgi:hypothetical protein
MRSHGIAGMADPGRERHRHKPAHSQRPQAQLAGAPGRAASLPEARAFRWTGMSSAVCDQAPARWPWQPGSRSALTHSS